MKYKSNIKYILLVIFAFVPVILVSTFFINLLIISKAPFEVAQGNDWIGFWGSVFGSSIGGIITFIVLKISINNENDKREDDKRMSVLPYLDYQIVTDEYIEKNLKTKHVSKSIPANGSVEPSEYSCNVQFKLSIENIGINKAIKPKVRTKESSDRFDKYEDIGRKYIEVGDNMIIDTFVRLDTRNRKEHFIELNIVYYNLRMDLYSQDITIICEPMGIRRKDELTIAAGFHPNIVNISAPVIINDNLT